MALLPCSECGQQISDTAAACPKCGAPIGKAGTATRSPDSPPPPPIQQATPQKRKRVSPALVAILVLLVGGVGYFFYQQRVEEEAREQALAVQRAAEQAEVKRRADQREEVLRNPNGFLETSEITSFDKGILNNYRQLTGFTLLNKSPFPLKELKGTVEWVNDDGESAGSTPFSLQGSISAGDTKKFSTSNGTMKSGTLQTGASKLRLKFEHVAIVE